MAIHNHEYAQTKLKVVTEERQSMQLQADMERNEKVEFQARETLRAVLKSQSDSEAHTSDTEPIEILSLDNQNDGEESSEGRSSVTTAQYIQEQRPQAVRVAQAQNREEEQEPETQHLDTDAELSVCACQRRGTHLGFGTGGERTGISQGG